MIYELFTYAENNFIAKMMHCIFICTPDGAGAVVGGDAMVFISAKNAQSKNSLKFILIVGLRCKRPWKWRLIRWWRLLVKIIVRVIVRRGLLDII